MKYTLTSLKIFEKECIQTYLARVTAAEEGKLGNRVKKIGEKLVLGYIVVVVPVVIFLGTVWL